MRTSKRPDLLIPSAHLYHSVDIAALARAGVNQPTSRVQVVDPSAVSDIGADHHSFKLMVVAVSSRAQVLAQSD
jgi:hypothetical protein